MVRTTKIVSDATRIRILDAAEICFFDIGISGTTLQTVAMQAGVTRGAVYWHFDDKEDLLKSVVERMSFPLLSELKRINDSHAQPICALGKVLFDSLNEVLKNSQLRRLVRIVYFSEEYLRISKLKGYDVGVNEIEFFDVFMSIIIKSKKLNQTEDYVNEKRLSCLLLSTYLSLLKNAVTVSADNLLVKEGTENLKWLLRQGGLCQQ